MHRQSLFLTLLLAVTVCAATHAADLGDLMRLQPGQTMRSSSSDPNWQNGNGDARPIPPGETLTIGDLEGPGIIRHFWNTIAADERGYSRLLVLRMYWDGEENPSVECPIGDFFGVGHGMDVPYASMPVKVSSEGRARNCYWPMPFRNSARITVTNEGREAVRALFWYLDWQKVPELPDDALYFHASYRQEYPTTPGQNYLFADIAGRGQYVGTVLSVRQLSASWWGEGDDFFFIDGAEEPTLRGTGSEDYFCDAWGLRQQDGPYYGMPIFEGYDAFDRTTCYRWHIPDPVSFDSSLRVEIEHKGATPTSGFEERLDDFSSVAFWYQAEPHQPYPALPAAYDRLYYDPVNILETESLAEPAKATAGGVSVQEGAWSGGAQLFWTPTEPLQTLDIPFSVEEAGGYDILTLVTHSWDYGTFQFSIDGQPAGQALDLYHPTVVVREHTLPRMELTAGDHVLSVTNTGKNPVSQGYFFGLDGLLLQKQK